MDKVLILASVASMIDQFNKSNIDILKQLGYEVHVAANFIRGSTSSKERVEEFVRELQQRQIRYHHVDLSRDIGSIASNFSACRRMKSLIKEYRYRFIHCHSPIGGFCGRIAACATKTPVIYTAHGFHFYEGGPLLNWLLYYPVERRLARYTDVLITINQEDFERSRTLGAKNVHYVPGIGIETAKYLELASDRDRIREELGLAHDTVVLLTIGEMIKNKNQETALKAFARLPQRNIVYLICGRGELEEHLKRTSKALGIDDRIRFLGFRGDIPRICTAADVFVFPSFREGLSVALMEAMSAGLPIVCSRIRGNTDLLKEGMGGFLVEPLDIAGFAERIEELMRNPGLRLRMSAHNLQEARKYDVKIVNASMRAIYEGMVTVWDRTRA